MVDLDHDKTVRPTTTAISTKRKDLLSTSMKRTSEWIFSQEVPSDVIIHAGGTAFSLHKYPLVSKCGYIRKLLSQSTTDGNLPSIQLPRFPGGADAFELAAKFSYGINFEISIENIATLRCAAEYLEMTEEYAVRNLVGRTEAYLNEVALKSIGGATSVLRNSQNLIPIAEEVKMVSRCVDTTAYLACRDSHFCEANWGESGMEGVNSCSMAQMENIVDWWAEDLTVLRIDMFQRVLIAMMSRGFKQFALGPILMLYAKKYLAELETFGKGRNKIAQRQENDKRVVLETIVSLLPREKNSIPVSFLSMLLKAATFLQTTVASRLDLEKRTGLQLEQADLNDLLIPSFSVTGGTLFDVDSVKRIVMNYLEFQREGNRLRYEAGRDFLSPPRSEMARVGKLVENYLAEVASDQNLLVLEFVSVAELVPEHARVTEDGMYRAVDVFLKAHPALSETERKTACSVMDCQKLSPEASAHAAQNDRLPVQSTVQVLYHEQQRLRHIITGNFPGTDESPDLPHKLNLHHTHFHPVSNELSNLKRENQELKIQLVKMKMKLKGIEKSSDGSGLGSPSGSTSSSAITDKLRLARKSFISSLSRKLGRLYPFLHGGDGDTSPTKDRTKSRRFRRHSTS